MRGVIPAKKLCVQAESLCRDIQSGQIKRLQLILVGRRMDIGKLKRRVDIEFDRATFVHIDVFGERLPPFGIL